MAARTHLVNIRPVRSRCDRWVLTKEPAFHAQIADTSQLRAAASALITRQYAAAGYGEHEIPDGPDSVTLVLVTDQVIGTLTLTFDGAAGLLADQAYSRFLRDRRNVGGQCVEVTKLAFESGIQGRAAMDLLFDFAIQTMKARRATDLFIEVHPRHAAAYERRLGMWTVGRESQARRVNAPARLLWVDIRLLKTR
jgi:hypothetical protein